VILATVLSIVYPGIGQIYNRQKIKGFIFVLIQFILAVLNILALGKMNLLYNSIWVIGIIDAFVFAIINEKRTKHDLDETEDAEGKKRPWVLIVVTTVVAYLLHYGIAYMLGTALFSPPQLGMQQHAPSIKSEVLSYLEKKYHKKFVVDQEKYIWQTGAYQLVVHPADDPKLFFPVTKDEVYGIVDGYIQRLWVKQSTEEVTPIVKSIYPEHVTIESAVAIDEADEKKAVKLNKVLTYKEYRKKNKGYVHDLRIYVIKTVNPTEEKQNLFRLITELRKRGITELRLTAQYFDPVLLKKRVSSVNFDTQTEYFPYQTYICEPSEYDIKKIQTVDDLDQYFREIQQ